MQHGHDDFGRGTPLFGVNVHRNAATVVVHGDGFIGMNGDLDVGAIPRQSLVDGVVHDLENHVVQPGSIIGIADVHARSFAHCIKAL